MKIVKNSFVPLAPCWSTTITNSPTLKRNLDAWKMTCRRPKGPSESSVSLWLLTLKKGIEEVDTNALGTLEAIDKTKEDFDKKIEELRINMQEKIKNQKQEVLDHQVNTVEDMNQAREKTTETKAVLDALYLDIDKSLESFSDNAIVDSKQRAEAVLQEVIQKEFNQQCYSMITSQIKFSSLNWDLKFEALGRLSHHIRVLQCPVKFQDITKPLSPNPRESQHIQHRTGKLGSHEDVHKWRWPHCRWRKGQWRRILEVFYNWWRRCVGAEKGQSKRRWNNRDVLRWRKKEVSGSVPQKQKFAVAGLGRWQSTEQLPGTIHTSPQFCRRCRLHHCDG